MAKELHHIKKYVDRHHGRKLWVPCLIIFFSMLLLDMLMIQPYSPREGVGIHLIKITLFTGISFPFIYLTWREKSELEKVNREIWEDREMIEKREQLLKKILKEWKDIRFALDVSNIVAVTDEKGIITEVNDKFCEISKYKREELIGQPHRIVNSGYHSKSFFRDMWQTIRSGEVWKGEIKNRAKDGSEYWVDTSIIPFMNDKNQPYQYISIRRDITDRKRAEEKIAHMAYHDDLTGLPNRRLLKNQLELILKESQAEKKELAVLFLGLNRFKYINDSMGHACGDSSLKEIGKRLRGGLRSSDLVARMGGDEFMILVPMESGEEAQAVAEHVLGLLRKPFEMEGYEIYITASLGIAVYPHDGDHAEALLQHANRAMRVAKKQGNNHYHFYQQFNEPDVLNYMRLESDLHRALERKEFRVFYQPQIHFKTGEIIGAEALIRWEHPEKGLISPTKFIPIAEQTGLILPIGEWVLRTACMEAKKFQESGFPEFQISVNLSAKQFKATDLVQTISSILQESGLEPRFLELEITENMSMDDVEGSIRMLKQLKELGVCIAIDDFGTGYCSLGYLNNFPIHTLKIDQSFIRDMKDDESNAAIVSTILAMAEHLGLEVVAEGVEKYHHFEFLHKRNCTKGQGYWFSRPLPSLSKESFQNIEMEVQSKIDSDSHRLNEKAGKS